MFWSRKRPESAPKTRPAFRPRLEALEDRLALNFSSVIDSAGNNVIFAVYDNGSLYQYDKTGAHLLAPANVLRVHGYRNFDGTVGLIVIYNSSLNFMAFDYNNQGATFLGENIVDAAKAYDKNNSVVLDVTFSSGGSFVTVEYTPTTATVVDQGTNVAVLIHPFQDAQGAVGRLVSYFDTVTSCTLIQYDSTGALFLAEDAVADKTVAPNGATFILDVTFISNDAVSYTPTEALYRGNNISI